MKREHKVLRVWQTAMQLVEDVYRFTSTFPKDEQFGLTSQLRRAAISVPSNIAKGAARNGAKELIHFLGIASGSLAEIDTQIELAVRLAYATPDGALRTRLDEVSALNMALIKSLKQKLE